MTIPTYPPRPNRRTPHAALKRRAMRSPLPDWVFTAVLYGAMFLAFGLIDFACGAMTPESKAINAAEDAGYTNVEIIDRANLAVGLRGCDKNDGARFTVRGTNPRGEVRTFYVCAGVIKGGTIRSK